MHLPRGVSDATFCFLISSGIHGFQGFAQVYDDDDDDHHHHDDNDHYKDDDDDDDDDYDYDYDYDDDHDVVAGKSTPSNGYGEETSGTW